jgi:hypothetical protein
MWAPPSGHWNPEVRNRLLTDHGGHQVRIAEWADQQDLAGVDPGDWARGATEAQLQRCVRAADVTLGAHSWSHPNLATLPPADLTDEVARPLQWLRDRFDRVVPWFAYPYGLASPAAAGAVSHAGYTGALAIEGGWWARRVTDRFWLPRWNVPSGVSIEGFRVRLGGWLCR